jgi:DMSO reductase anchor subunit
MNPAWSVVLLTTLIGAGQGLFLTLYAIEAASAMGALAPPGNGYFAAGSLLAVALMGAGLAASFFHLGRPERAWRSAAMWRTSWLSREVVALPLAMALVAAYGSMHHADAARAATLWAGAAGVAACVALFVCTGMIYACVKFLEEWASAWTVLNFTLLGCASGATLATAWSAAAAPEAAVPVAAWAAIATALGWATRAAALARNRRLRHKSSLQSAIGIKHPRIEQKAQGAMGGSFNTREFFHGRSREVLRAVKAGFLVAAFAAPLALIAAGWFLAAFLVQFAGLLAERWYFFAEARHPQNLYYQTIS